MGKRTDEVAKMVVEHYKLPIEPKDWIDRSRHCQHFDHDHHDRHIVIMMILHRKVYNELFPSVPALPGVAKLVHHLARNQVQPHHHLDDDQHNDHHNNNDDQHRHNKDDDHQIKTAVATSSSSHSFELKTSNHSGLFSLFDKLVIINHYQTSSSNHQSLCVLGENIKINIVKLFTIILKDFW